MKILVLSNTPWDTNNSFGNSYSNIFSGMQDLEFANIYCRAGNPYNDIPMKCFQITTGAMAKSIFRTKKTITGHVVEKKESNGVELTSMQSDLFNQARKMRWVLMLWVREFIWQMGKWKSNELLCFLDEYQPDLIFQPIYGQGYSYINRIALFIKEYTGASMVGYVSDDVYSYRQISISPLYWIDRIARHKILKKTMCSCEILYVISKIQKQEYEKALGIPCKVLTKGIRDAETDCPIQTLGKPLKLIYAGNIGEGRWRTLADIGKALDQINVNGNIAELYLYTATPMSKKMYKALQKTSIHLMGKVDSSVVPSLYEQSDILVHVESLKLKERLLVHQSFSTKLVDYFAIGKCIFAVGPKDVASVQHLSENDAAIIATNRQEIEKQLNVILQNQDIIHQYGKRAWDCGKNHHLTRKFQKMLLDDFEQILENYSREDSGN